ncbi:hypothetical protein C2G38_2226504 [Gigaspora rosea]|uniref:Homeodomain-like protein n=1 Tax=Gigaspora rosea TaxID=44941 RepID=A0A397U167_9GLOM|nr:hypothetical protein C2G38_2226504 [Gigaspora rosea]
MPLAYSNDLKERIVFLHFDGYDRKTIAELLYISKQLVNKVLRIYYKWGCVEHPFKRQRGRKKILSREDMQLIGT